MQKARRRYRVAEASANALQNAPSYEAFADQWYIFLHAAKGIYTILQQGSKATAQAKQWFGGKNEERKKDPLLRYVTEARNDDEHGLEESTAVQPGSLELGVAAPGASAIMRDQYGNTFANCGIAWRIDGARPGMMNLPRLGPLDGKPVKTVFSPEKIVLKPVLDRSRRTYDPPKSHLASDLKTGDPQEVATLALTYLRDLIAEAEVLHKP